MAVALKKTRVMPLADSVKSLTICALKTFTLLQCDGQTSGNAENNIMLCPCYKLPKSSWQWSPLPRYLRVCYRGHGDLLYGT